MNNTTFFRNLDMHFHNALGIPKRMHAHIGQQLHYTALQHPMCTHPEMLTDVISKVNCYITTTWRAFSQPPSLLSN